METFHSPGKTSSRKDYSEEDALKKLKELSGSNKIASLRNALGEDADLHIVGGTVRDILSNSSGYDIDLASRLPPDVAVDRLQAHNIRVIETGLVHGTLTAVVDHTNIEITTFRKAQERHISGFAETIEEDLAGRDFTINAIAYSVELDRLVDPLKGIQDLKDNILRAAVSANDRLREDPLRIMRMIRFGPAAGRNVEKDLLEAARKLSPLLNKVSVERIRDELLKILLYPHAANGIRIMQESGILEHVLPEALPSVDFPQNKYHIEDVFQHTLTVIDRSPPDPALRLSALFHDLGKPETLSVDEKGERHFYKHEIESARICKTAMKRLRFSNEMIKKVSTIVWAHMRPIECGPAGIRRLQRDLADYFDDWRIFKVADKPPVMSDGEFKQKLQEFDQMVKDEVQRQANSAKKLLVDGNDLMRLGFKSGKALGDTLKLLEERVLENPELNNKKTLLSLAEELKREQG